MGYFQELWNNQPATVIGVGTATLVLLRIYINFFSINISNDWYDIKVDSRSTLEGITTLFFNVH